MYHVNTRMRERGLTQIPGLWTLDGNQVDFLFEPPGLARRLAPEADHNPYRGLLPYEAPDCDLFFGPLGADKRRDLLQRITNNPSPLVASIGRSGVGKSSLLRAGLIGGLLYPRYRDTQPQQLAPLKKEERPLRQAAYRPMAGTAGWAMLLLRPQASPVSYWRKCWGSFWGRRSAQN